MGGIADTMNLRQSMSLGVLKDLLSLRFGRTVAGLVRSHIPDSRIAQMMDHFTQYVDPRPNSSGGAVRNCAHADQ